LNPAWRRNLARHPLVAKGILHHGVTLTGLLLLLILIFTGTLYQADHGLYEAQRKFFGYEIIMVQGFFPLPGASLVLWVLALQLAVTMLLIHQLSWKKLGLWIVHLGLLLLLIGGFLTQTLAVESQLTLAEGETGRYTTAYHEWELAVWETKGDSNIVTAFVDKDLQPGVNLDFSPYPFRLKVRQYFPNAEAFAGMATGGIQPYMNASGITLIEARKEEKEAAENSPGIIASWQEPGKNTREVLLSGLEVKPLAVKIGERRLLCQLRRRHYPLPFALKLTDFVQDLHPGTDVARSYESYAELQEGQASRTVHIFMNNPLRLRGYTLFQASFSRDDMGGERSTFAVVTNPGRVLPYVCSLMVFGGMLLHFVLRLVGYVRREVPA